MMKKVILSNEQGNVKSMTVKYFRRIIRRSKSLILISQIYKYLDNRCKKKILETWALGLISALLELIAIAWLVPFTLILANEESEIETFLYTITSAGSKKDLLLIVCVAIIVFTTVSGYIRLKSLKQSSKNTAILGSYLTQKAFQNIIYQDLLFVKRNDTSSILAKMEYSSLVVGGVIYPVISSINNFTLIIIFGSTIIFAYASIIATLSILIIGFYAIVKSKNTAEISTINSGSSVYSKKWISTINEAFGSMRDILIGGHQDIFVDKFQDADTKIRELGAQSQYIGANPKIIAESFFLIMLAVISSTFIISNQNTQALAFVTVFVVCIQKLLPAAQQIYAAYTSVSSHNYAMKGLIELLELTHFSKKTYDYAKYAITKKQALISIEKGELVYDEAQPIIESINLQINEGDIVGLIGKSGTGKSSLLDLVMGLYPPNKGIIYMSNSRVFDKNNKIDNINLIRNQIGLVAQDSFFMNASIGTNITFEEDYKEWDISRLIKVLKASESYEFVEKLPEQYNTNIGENGCRISGGQRQRIAIARALYMQRPILILDEATSGLDAQTEKIVLNNIKKLKYIKAIIMVTHREQSLSICNLIWEIKNKKVYS